MLNYLELGVMVRNAVYVPLLYWDYALFEMLKKSPTEPPGVEKQLFMPVGVDARAVYGKRQLHVQALLTYRTKRVRYSLDL